MRGRVEWIDGHRRFTPDDTPEDARGARLTDQAALPGALADFLRLPDVYVRPDEARAEVVIAMPSYLAYQLAPLCPNPLNVQLAAGLAEAAEQDAEDHRRDLLDDRTPS